MEKGKSIAGSCSSTKDRVQKKRTNTSNVIIFGYNQKSTITSQQQQQLLKTTGMYFTEVGAKMYYMQHPEKK
jgi:hypothetical protein